MTDAPSTAAPRSATGARETFARALEPLLGRELHRLRRRYVVHGIGYLLLLPMVAVMAFFALDHFLRLPVAIRLLHSAVLAAITAFAAHRFVLYPLRRRLTAIDLALALERAFPDLHERLVTAVQLAGRSEDELRNQSPAMVAALVRDTADAVGRLPLGRFLDGRRTLRILAAGGLAALLVLAGVIGSPETAKIFFLRHVGMQADYPRETYLTVSLPPGGPELQRVDQDGRTDILIPAGGELHVSVQARGVIPKEVFLEVAPLADDGVPRRGPRSVPMTPRPGDRFRHVFRKLSGAFEFHARGGDDESGDRLVRVRTIRPPRIAGIRTRVQPPAYAGIPPAEREGGAVEALVGSEIELLATTTAVVREAAMVFLESGRRIPLEPVTVQDDSGVATAWRTDFTLRDSDRYQIELVGESGLRNPDPGTYPLDALKDYAPVGRWLLPPAQNLLLLRGALLCVRLEARDDFGLSHVLLSIDRAGKRVHEAPLFEAGEGAPTKSTVRTELVEVRDLLADAGGTAAAGDGLSVALTLRDNRLPVAGEVELPHRIVQIVEPPQLLELITRHFRRLREEANSALDIQLDRRQRLEELLGDPIDRTEAEHVLSAVEVGQSRVLDGCVRLHRGLMDAFDTHLWNRLESSPEAAAVVELFREFSAALDEPLARDPDFYRELIRRRQKGAIGALETALDPILAMIGVADALATKECPRTMRLLAEAQVAPEGDRAAIVRTVLDRQQAIAEALRLLLSRLEEWNDYQDLVQEARALRDRQRDIRLRTEELRGKK